MGFLLRRKVEPKPLPPIMDVRGELAEDVVDFHVFRGGAALQFSNGKIEESVKSMTKYAVEWMGLGMVDRPDGKPILSGLGLYPEMGADLVPLVVTRNYGRLIGMSLHESELISGGEVLKMYDIKPDKVLGKFRVSSAVKRDVDAIVAGLDLKEVKDVLNRIKIGARKIGGDIGTKNWRESGRLLEFDSLTFLPSASGDEKVLNHYLRGRKLDYMILKGHTMFRWKGDVEKAKVWMDKVDEKYLADDTVLIISKEDEGITKHMLAKGYTEMENPYKVEYTHPNPPNLSINTEFSPNSICGVKLAPTYIEPSLYPKGDFTILLRNKK